MLVKMNVLLHLKDCSEILYVGLSNPKNLILPQDFCYMVWIKSYLHVNTDVKISCLTLCQNSGSKIEFYGSKMSVEKKSAPPS